MKVYALIWSVLTWWLLQREYDSSISGSMYLFAVIYALQGSLKFSEKLSF